MFLKDLKSKSVNPDNKVLESHQGMVSGKSSKGTERLLS